MTSPDPRQPNPTTWIHFILACAVPVADSPDGICGEFIESEPCKTHGTEAPMPDLPEEAAPPRLRHGNRNRQNLYLLCEDGSEEFMGVAMTPEYADMIVQRFNAATVTEADIVDRWWRDREAMQDRATADLIAEQEARTDGTA